MAVHSGLGWLAIAFLSFATLPRNLGFVLLTNGFTLITDLARLQRSGGFSSGKWSIVDTARIHTPSCALQPSGPTTSVGKVGATTVLSSSGVVWNTHCAIRSRFRHGLRVQIHASHWASRLKAPPLPPPFGINGTSTRARAS